MGFVPGKDMLIPFIDIRIRISICVCIYLRFYIQDKIFHRWFQSRRISLVMREQWQILFWGKGWAGLE